MLRAFRPSPPARSFRSALAPFLPAVYVRKCRQIADLNIQVDGLALPSRIRAAVGRFHLHAPFLKPQLQSLPDLFAFADMIALFDALQGVGQLGVNLEAVHFFRRHQVYTFIDDPQGIKAG